MVFTLVLFLVHLFIRYVLISSIIVMIGLLFALTITLLKTSLILLTIVSHTEHGPGPKSSGKHQHERQ